jgi:GAF domain-containing protein
VSNSRLDAGREHALLEAVAIAAERLLQGSGSPPVPDVLEILGVSIDASRVALVAARRGGGGSAPRMESRQQWSAPGVARLQPGADGWPRYPARWRDELGRGTTLAGPAGAFPAAERAAFEASGTRSMLLVPVEAGATWYGHLVCHDTRSERTWSPAEVDAMRAAATILGSAIELRRVQAELERRTTLLRAVGVASSLLLEANNWRQALPRVLDALRTATRCRSAWVYAPDPDHPARRAVLLYEVLAPGARPGGSRPRALELTAETGARLETAGTIHDGIVDEDLRPVADAIGHRPGVSWAVTPMVLEPGALGMVGLETDTRRTWTEGELDALGIVAAALRAAIHRGGTLVSVPIVANPWGQATAIEPGAPVEARVPVEERRNPG